MSRLNLTKGTNWNWIIKCQNCQIYTIGALSPPYSKRSDGIGQTVHKSLTNDIINQESSQTYSSADLDLEMGGSSRTGLLSGDRLTDTLGGSLCVDCKLPKLWLSAPCCTLVNLSVFLSQLVSKSQSNSMLYLVFKRYKLFINDTKGFAHIIFLWCKICTDRQIISTDMTIKYSRT